jgi:hypothetical protein
MKPSEFCIPGNPAMSTSPCTCEHVAHSDREARTPCGNPGHDYGQAFYSPLVAVRTPYGVFTVCRDCERDCLGRYTS